MRKEGWLIRLAVCTYFGTGDLKWENTWYSSRRLPNNSIPGEDEFQLEDYHHKFSQESRGTKRENEREGELVIFFYFEKNS